MAGVLFIIWVPCENYEQVLLNKQDWERTQQANEQHQQFTTSSDEENDYINSKVRKIERRVEIFLKI